MLPTFFRVPTPDEVLMTEPPYERHPLDDDADGAENNPRSKRTHEGRDMTQAYQPLLRASKYILIGSGAIVFLSGVAASNAQPNSGFESVAISVNRLSVMALLCGFVMLLVAFRIPHMQISLAGFSPEDRAASPGSRSSLATSSSSASNSRATRRQAPGIEQLLIINASLIGLIWITLALSPAIIYDALLLAYSGLMIISMGLLVTMVIWNKGWLKAYAVGVLVALLPVILWSFTSARILMFRGGWETTLMVSILMSLPFLTGLACAGYVYYLVHTTMGPSPPPPLRKYTFVELPIKNGTKNRTRREPPRLPPEALAEQNRPRNGSNQD